MSESKKRNAALTWSSQPRNWKTRKKEPELKEEFEKLKMALSGNYPGERYKWLRCCLYGSVPGAELDRTKVGATLFHALELQGRISPTDVGLLSEITELTSVQSAIDCVNKYKQDNEVEDSEKKSLTPYRRGLVKALMGAGNDEFNTVICNYQELIPYKFDNLWDAVFKLEKTRLLEDNPEKIQCFVNLLEEGTKAIFLGEIGGFGSEQSASTSSTSSATQSTSAGQSGSESLITQQDEKIRKYLLEKQKQVCSNYSRFTPPTMQSRFQVDIAHMFTDLDLLKENNMRNKKATTITLDDVLDIIKDKPACKVLIEGEGGIGKTTLLRYLAYNWSTDKSVFKDKIIFVINIRDVGKGEDILDVIVKQINLKYFKRKTNLKTESKNLIEQFMIEHDDEIVLMLDGLDELKIGSENPISLFKKEELPKSIVIITSRSENINEFIKESDVHLRVKGFSKEKVEEYINKYFKSRLELGYNLVKKITYVHIELLSMCRNPMLLLLTCIMWEEKQEIPSDKDDLFREVFRCIINQYNRGENKPKISNFEDAPKEYVSAMCLLGQCMYSGLKKNQLSINKRDLVANEDVVVTALKLGFVYKDESFLKTNFEEIYAAPHKLIVEALVGFYLYKLFENTLDIPHKLSLDDSDLEVIRESSQLQNAKEFTIGFLGANADKFLRNWITNRLSTYRALCCFEINFVKQTHAATVVRSLIEHRSVITANLEINRYIPNVCRSLRMFLHHVNPNTNVDEDEDILILIRKVYDIEGIIDIHEFSKKLSSKEKGQILAHITVALSNQTMVFRYIIKELNIKEMRNFIARCEEFLIKFQMYVLDVSANNLDHVDGKLLSSLLHISPWLTNLDMQNCNLRSDVINDMVTDYSSRGAKLKLQFLNISNNELTNTDGKSLASLMDICPELTELKMHKCSLTGNVINDMVTICSNMVIKLELHYLNISDNDFMNIDGTSLASLMNMSPKLGILEMHNCNLTGDVINVMVSECSNMGIELKLCNLYIGDNDLSKIDDTSLASLMNISPKLVELDIHNCKLLTGNAISYMITDCSSRGIRLKLQILNISDNNLNNIDGRLLASLMYISPPLEELHMQNCNLTGDVINNMTVECSSRGIKLKLKSLDIDDNNLDINGRTLVSLINISPYLDTLHMNNCTLTGVVINTMMVDCSSRDLKLQTLGISDNNLSNLDVTSLPSLMDISPKLDRLLMHNCNLTGVLINDTMADCCSRGIKLNLRILDISVNNLRDVDGTLLASLINNIFLQLIQLNMHKCNLTGKVIGDMIAACSSKASKLELQSLVIGGNNLSSIDAISLGSLMAISPRLGTLKMNNCNLTGNVINDMITDCSSKRITLRLHTLNISGDGKSLASLMNISPRLSILSMHDCNLTGDVINDMISNCSSKAEELKYLDIGNNNFLNIDGRSLGALTDIFPQLGILKMHNCNLTGNIINYMTDCSSRRINMKLRYLNISDNELSNIDGISLGSVMDIYPKLHTLHMYNCNLKGLVINDDDFFNIIMHFLFKIVLKEI